MFRGTTPTFQIELPSNINVADIDVAYLSFEEFSTKLIEKDLSDMSIDTDANTLTVILTQEETLLLQSGTVSYQLRFGIGGSKYATQIWQIPAERIIKDGEI